MRLRLNLTPTRLVVLRAIAQGVEPEIAGHAARKARAELHEAGLVSLPQEYIPDPSWADWGLTLDGRLVMSQLTEAA
jgi:hypothetical protein